MEVGGRRRGWWRRTGSSDANIDTCTQTHTTQTHTHINQCSFSHKHDSTPWHRGGQRTSSPPRSTTISTPFLLPPHTERGEVLSSVARPSLPFHHFSLLPSTQLCPTPIPPTRSRAQRAACSRRLRRGGAGAWAVWSGVWWASVCVWVGGRVCVCVCQSVCEVCGGRKERKTHRYRS